jgi:hypothetical protein
MRKKQKAKLTTGKSIATFERVVMEDVKLAGRAVILLQTTVDLKIPP